MFWSTFIVWASHKLNFLRGLTWFVCGLAMGINSIVLGLILLAVSLVLNFLAARLEIAAERRKVSVPSPAPKPSETAVKMQNNPYEIFAPVIEEALRSAMAIHDE